MAPSKRFSLIPDYGDPNDPLVRARYGYLEGIVSIVGNTALFILKFILGIFINSIALIADSFHTLSDVGSSVVVIIGFKIAKKPSDKTHPFGYGRVEYIATLIIAIMFLITGIEFVQQSLERIINNIKITHEEFALLIGIVLVISAFIKEWMARFSLALGKKINSDILVADAWHHRSDAFASIAVGISIVLSSYGFSVVDPIFGIVVSLIIIYVGLGLVRSSSHFLIGMKPDEELVKNIENIGRSTKGVRGIHDISIHDYGTNKVITLHAEVDNGLILDDAHAIADKLEQKIQKKTNCSTIIHVEPKELRKDDLAKKKLIENVLDRQQGVISFHKIQIIRGKEKDDITMHLVVDRDMSVQNSHDLCHRIESIIQKTYGPCDVHIHLEPCSDKDCNVCDISCNKKKNEVRR